MTLCILMDIVNKLPTNYSFSTAWISIEKYFDINMR